MQELKSLGQEGGIYSKVEVCQHEKRKKWLQQYLLKTGKVTARRERQRQRHQKREQETERPHYPKLLNAQ